MDTLIYFILGFFGVISHCIMKSDLLTQGGTTPPNATVLENTLGGTVVWTRNDAGFYHGTLMGAFTNHKTFCTANGGVNSAYGGYKIALHRNDLGNYVNLITTSGVNGVDGLLFEASIEIRVYN